jgi:hypothetical protein
MDNTPLIERVRQLADAMASEDDELDFYAAALQLGVSEKQADEISTQLNERVIRALGVI